MDSLILPGLDIITPEMQASFSSNNSVISMNSDKWKLLGDSKILNDNKFMKSFDIVSYNYYYAIYNSSFFVCMYDVHVDCKPLYIHSLCMYVHLLIHASTYCIHTYTICTHIYIETNWSDWISFYYSQSQ